MRKNLAENIIEQLQRSPLAQAAEILSFDDTLRLELRLADCDRLACLLDSLKLEHKQVGSLALDPERIETQVTYLGERLKTIETGGRERKTIMRSLPPRVWQDVVSFFEIVLERSTSLSLVRYMYSPKLGRRIAVPATLTWDTLERLISDLIELVRET